MTNNTTLTDFERLTCISALVLQLSTSKAYFDSIEIQKEIEEGIEISKHKAIACNWQILSDVFPVLAIKFLTEISSPNLKQLADSQIKEVSTNNLFFDTDYSVIKSLMIVDTDSSQSSTKTQVN